MSTLSHIRVPKARLEPLTLELMNSKGMSKTAAEKEAREQLRQQIFQEQDDSLRTETASLEAELEALSQPPDDASATGAQTAPSESNSAASSAARVSRPSRRCQRMMPVSSESSQFVPNESEGYKAAQKALERQTQAKASALSAAIKEAQTEADAQKRQATVSGTKRQQRSARSNLVCAAQSVQQPATKQAKLTDLPKDPILRAQIGGSFLRKGPAPGLEQPLPVTWSVCSY